MRNTRGLRALVTPGETRIRFHPEAGEGAMRGFEAKGSHGPIRIFNGPFWRNAQEVSGWMWE